MDAQPIIQNGKEFRRHERTATIPEFGRSYCYVTCPFCEFEVKAFVWSLYGGGKKCPRCGAVHGGWGLSSKKVKDET